MAPSIGQPYIIFSSLSGEGVPSSERRSGEESGAISAGAGVAQPRTEVGPGSSGQRAPQTERTLGQDQTERARAGREPQTRRETQRLHQVST